MRFLFVLLLVCVSLKLQAQDDNATDSLPRYNKRLWLVGSGHLATYTGTLMILDGMWYRDYPRSSFHFFDDFNEWKQTDKVAHTINAYHLSLLSFETFRWAGLSNNRAALWGSISGSVFLTTVEILDGLSSQWGASPGDLAANMVGSLSFFAQQIAWQEQKILFKYSYSDSGLHQYRPELLGKNLPENIIKDYNGLTFWLSFNLHDLTGDFVNLPPWLNLAVGYGATGLLGGTENPTAVNNVVLPQLKRSRQFYLSPDVDYGRINTRNKNLQRLLSTLNLLKFPAPAIGYTQNEGFSFHLIFW